MLRSIFLSLIALVLIVTAGCGKSPAGPSKPAGPGGSPSNGAAAPAVHDGGGKIVRQL